MPSTVAERARLSRTNFAEFCSFVGDIKLSSHQTDLIDACQDVVDRPEGGQKYVVVMPPGFGKSTVVAVLLNAMMIGRNPDSHFGLLSYGNKPAYARSRAIRKVIKNDPAYRLVFPGVEPDHPWGAGEFSVRREQERDIFPTMLCGGTMSAVVSYRLKFLTLDDAISQKQAASTDQLLRAWENYETAIMTRLVRGAPQFCIGTRWTADDFIAELLKRSGWTLIHVAALGKDGRSTWPRGKTTKELQTIKFESPELFQVQYMGDPSAKGIGIIKKIATYKDVPDLEFVQSKDLLVAAGWDTAYKDKEKNDFSVGYVGGMDRWHRIWILDRRKGRFQTPELIEQLKDVQEAWDPYTQWVEDTGSGTAAVQTVMAELEDLLPLETEPAAGGGKRSSAHALSSYMHNGRVLLPKFAEWFEDSHYYLTKYPFTSWDDDIDALWLLVRKLIVMQHPAEFSDRSKYSLKMR